MENVMIKKELIALFPIHFDPVELIGKVRHEQKAIGQYSKDLEEMKKATREYLERLEVKL